jgi:hypothetical protein
MKSKAHERALTYGELMWLVGILEGEGYFGIHNARGYAYPIITLRMTDYDVVCQVCYLFGRDDSPTVTTIEDRKPMYSAQIVGKPARRIMQLVRPHMFSRRGHRIDTILASTDTPNEPRKKAILEELGLEV